MSIDLTETEREALLEGGLSGNITEAEWLVVVGLTRKGLVIPDIDSPSEFKLTPKGRALVERLEGSVDKPTTPCTWDSWARIPRDEYQRRMSAYRSGDGPLWKECDKAAVYIVGSREAWHLCEEHVNDPTFKRMKKVYQWPENRSAVIEAMERGEDQ